MPKKPYKFDLFAEMKLMLRVIDGCINTRILPKKGSPCHRKLRELIAKAKQYKKVHGYERRDGKTR